MEARVVVQTFGSRAEDGESLLAKCVCEVLPESTTNSDASEPKRQLTAKELRTSFSDSVLVVSLFLSAIESRPLGPLANGELVDDETDVRLRDLTSSSTSIASSAGGDILEAGESTVLGGD